MNTRKNHWGWGKTAGLLLLGLLLLPPAVIGNEEGPGIGVDQAEALLKAGNNRYVQDRMDHPHQNPERRQEVMKGQHPYVTVITCSDSRVPPETIFDAGLGDLFIIRVAGNVCDIDETGSIEYGVDHLGTPLLVVMGHTRCGAIQAVATHAEVHGSIPQLVDNILPAVEAAKEAHPDLEGDALVAQAVKANVWQSIEDLLQRSAIIRGRVESGKVKVVGAIYHLEDGEVEWLGTHPKQDELMAAHPAETEHGAEGSHQAEAAQDGPFVHVVYFWLKDGTTEERKKQLMDDCQNYLGSIKNVRKILVGTPAGTPRDVVDNSYGVNLMVYFASPEDHDVYQKHEKHLQFIDRNQDIWERVQVYDMMQGAASGEDSAAPHH